MTHEQDARGDRHRAPSIDPVCGMIVIRGDSGSLVFRGTRYWFCNPACARTFRDEPTRWASGAPLVHDQGAPAGDAAATRRAGGHE